MRVHTPTSIEQVRRHMDLTDVFGVLFAAPIALALRDPNLFGHEHNVEAIIYSTIAFRAVQCSIVSLLCNSFQPFEVRGETEDSAG